MRTQTFGIEIETTGLGRKRTAEVIAQYFGTTAQHIGAHLDDWKIPMPDGRKWTVESDGSVTDPSAEVVSPVCRWEDIEMVQEVVRALRKAGANAGASRWSRNSSQLSTAGSLPPWMPSPSFGTNTAEGAPATGGDMHAGITTPAATTCSTFMQLSPRSALPVPSSFAPSTQHYTPERSKATSSFALPSAPKHSTASQQAPQGRKPTTRNTPSAAGSSAWASSERSLKPPACT